MDQKKNKGLFGTAFDPEKEEVFWNWSLKTFKAYVFGLRSGVTYKPAAGWNIKDEKDIELLLKIIETEANITDAL